MSALVHGQFIVEEQLPIDLDIQNPRVVRSGDIDGVLPILADDVLVWYRNQTVLSVEDIQLEIIKIHTQKII